MSLKALAPIAIFVLLTSLFAFGLTRDPSRLPSELLDREFPQVTLTNLADGESLDSRDVVTGDVRLINIFGSWCVACLQEHPLLMELSERDIVEIVGINWRDDETDAKSWLARHGDPYTIILADTKGRLIIPLGVTGAPETFVVDAQGRIRYKHVGPITPEVWARTLQPLVRQLRQS